MRFASALLAKSEEELEQNGRGQALSRNHEVGIRGEKNSGGRRLAHELFRRNSRSPFGDEILMQCSRILACNRLSFKILR